MKVTIFDKRGSLIKIETRWKSGDPEILEAVKNFAQYTEDARSALEESDWTTLASLMDQVRNI